MKTTTRQTLLAMTFCALGSWNATQAQTASPVLLQVDVQNFVGYVEDTSDITKYATLLNVTTAAPPNNFYSGVQIGDIVAVNGQPAKGAVTNHVRAIRLTPTPNPGQSVADTTRVYVAVGGYEFLTSDGTLVGSILTTGLAGTGAPPPGSPLGQTQGNNAITGGTGAFIGARGTHGQDATPPFGNARTASITEDPANRRINGGGTVRFLLEVFPMTVPEIVAGAHGPEILHADLSRVTADRPAMPGEVLTAKATGMGPTASGVGPGLPFPTDTPQSVNSPVTVTVNGQPVEVVNAVGWPGYVGVYRVDFQMPDTTGTGTASIQLSSAWIPGPAVSIPVQ